VPKDGTVVAVRRLPPSIGRIGDERPPVAADGTRDRPAASYPRRLR
jgi:hypothetical protein